MTAGTGPAARAQAAPARAASQAAPGGADTASCAGCHGPTGEGVGAFPRLAGGGSAYLREQLEAFASGRRKSAVMQPIAQALSPTQRTGLASFYAGLPKPGVTADIEPTGSADTGAWLATRGRWNDDLPACAQCHGPGGIGVGASFPPLAGQPAAYLAEQLQAWRSSTRPPGPLGLMQIVASKLSDADIKAVSGYYAELPGRAPAVAAKARTKGAP